MCSGKLSRSSSTSYYVSRTSPRSASGQFKPSPDKIEACGSPDLGAETPTASRALLRRRPAGPLLITGRRPSGARRRGSSRSCWTCWPGMGNSRAAMHRAGRVRRSSAARRDAYAPYAGGRRRLPHPAGLAPPVARPSRPRGLLPCARRATDKPRAEIRARGHPGRAARRRHSHCSKQTSCLDRHPAPL